MSGSSFKPLEYSYSSNRPVRTLYHLLNRRPRFYLLLFLLFAVKHSPLMVVPFLLARIIDTLAAPDQSPVDLLPTYFTVITVLIVQNIATHVWFATLLSNGIRDMEKRLRSAVTTRMQQLSIAFHDRTESGRLQAKVLRDAEQIQNLCNFLGQMGIAAVISFFFAVIVTAVREPRLLVFYVVLAPLSSGLMTIFRRRMKSRNREFRSEVERMNSEVAEMINMIPVARAHGIEEQAIQDSHKKFQGVQRRGRRLDRMNALFGSSAFVAFQMSMIVGLAALSWVCWKGWISVGEIVLFQGLFSMIVTSVSSLLNLIPEVARGFESIRSIGEILECPDIERNAGRRKVEQVHGAVAFEDVGFTYENAAAPAVRGFSLDVRPGECIALVGPSGAGKSTIIHLLIGFHRPERGRILLDGIDMEELDMRTYRRFVSVAPQETMLFSGSLRDNITYGLTGIDEKQFQQVLTMSNLTDVVNEMPDGWRTRIGEDGALLSGGQRQRIAIARALIRDPRILILDEATSALDVLSEKLVQEAIDRAVQNRTTFIVAHRLSTIRRADRIVVMKDGRIAEIGSYDELMVQRGLFFEMQRVQH
jgi:ATP-binding cassette subfamily B protein